MLDRVIPDEELRVTPDEVSALFEQRPGSLLLDRYDDEDFVPDGERQTTATTISGYTDEGGGTPTEGSRFVDTPDGPGLRMYTPPAGVDVS